MTNRLVKLLALVLTLMLVLSSCSMIVIDEEMDNAQTAAVVGDEIITKGEAQELYDYYVDYYAYLYSMYGLDSSAIDAEALKQDVLDSMVQERLVAQKAVELGLDQLTEEQLAEVEAAANEELESYITTYSEEVTEEGMTAEEARTATLAYLEENGVTLDSLIETEKDLMVTDLVREYAVADVTVSDEALNASYEEKVAADESSYSSSVYMFEYAKTNGDTVYWTPEGYRTVKHILLMMTDEQSEALSALNTELSDINSRITALETPAEEAEETEEAEEAEETLTLEELNELKAAKEQEIAAKKDEIFASFTEKTEEIISRFEAGESFDTLIAEYGEDPGMQAEPAMTEGYVVCANSILWEAEFTENAMAIEQVGQISAPFLGSNGVHIVYYNSDVTAGATPLEDVKEDLTAELLAAQQEEAYAATLEEWTAAANVKTYPKVLDEHSHETDSHAGHNH